jgi:hypothetical protein
MVRDSRLARVTTTTTLLSDAPDVCPITVNLITAATQGWTPTRNCLYHTNVRMAVHTVLLATERLHLLSLADSPTHTHDVLPILPPEIWVPLRFLLRSEWPVSSVAAGVEGGESEWETTDE